MRSINLADISIVLYPSPYKSVRETSSRFSRILGVDCDISVTINKDKNIIEVQGDVPALLTWEKTGDYLGVRFKAKPKIKKIALYDGGYVDREEFTYNSEFVKVTFTGNCDVYVDWGHENLYNNKLYPGHILQ